MMKKLLMVAITGVIIMLNACSGKNLNFYDGTEPKADIKEFFNGDIKAWGLIQDRKGRAITRFDVDMQGLWEGDKGVLNEQFKYYDGKTQERIWKITKNQDGTYEGTASDIIGKATGAENGSAVKWSYTMDIPVDGKIYRFKLDDWMWQMNDGVLINRSYIKKFGITMAELTLIMQKVD